MTVENASTIGELNPNLPDADDPASEGDDHLRLLKQVLQADAVSKSDPVELVQPIVFQGDSLVEAPGIIIRDVSQPADGKDFIIENDAGELVIAPQTDAGVITPGTSYVFRRDGTATDAEDVLCKRDGDRLYSAGAGGAPVLWTGEVLGDGTGGAVGFGNWSASRTSAGVYRVTIGAMGGTEIAHVSISGTTPRAIAVEVDNLGGGFDVYIEGAVDSGFFFSVFESFEN